MPLDASSQSTAASQPSEASSLKPFVVVLHRRDIAQDGHFRPDATLTVTSALRTSGLWEGLRPDDLKVLLLLLTYLTPNGDCLPSVIQLASFMRISPFRARSRLRRLAALRWHGDPQVIEVPSAFGLDAFAPSPSILGYMQDPAEREPPKPVASSRDAVIAYSRQHYARPRAEVERDIAQRNSWEVARDDEETPEGTRMREVRNRLLFIGVPKEQAEALLTEYGAERCLRQLDWLKYRKARRPALYVVAAIEHDYGEPRAARMPGVGDPPPEQEGEDA